jgi:hypothetical protein
LIATPLKIDGIEEIRSFNYAMGGTFTGTFRLSHEEIKEGFRCGKVDNKDGSIFLGKYIEKNDKIHMVEGTLYYVNGEKRFLGKLWENKPSDGLFVFSNGQRDARVLPYD